MKRCDEAIAFWVDSGRLETVKMSFPSRRERRFHFSRHVNYTPILESISRRFSRQFGYQGAENCFQARLWNRSQFETLFQRGRTGRGGEGAQRLRWAGSHEDGANFSTYSSLCRATGETNGRDHCQKSSVFSVLHQNLKYAQNIKGGFCISKRWVGQFVDLTFSRFRMETFCPLGIELENQVFERLGT